jgi:DNA-binding PucR family transcriptional regulator
MNALAKLCAAVDRDVVTRRSVERIRAELPVYESIPLHEHTAAVARQQHNQLEALERGEEVSGPALADAERLARRRANQGIDIEVLLGAYHLGDEVLWSALVEVADQTTKDALPNAASLVFASLHRLSRTLTAAHAEVSSVLQTRRVTASQRLIDLLLAGHIGPEVEVHARVLGLDISGQFVAAFWRGRRPATMPVTILSGLEADRAQVVIGHGSDGVAALSQGSSAEDVASLIDRGTADSTSVGLGVGVGVGLARHGLDGAARSLGDARLASHGALRGGSNVVRFDEAWADVCVLAERRRLAPITSSIAIVGRSHPHLAESVSAFARADMNLSRAARMLRLHPNSLSYRLDRWASLTGWNARTFDGLRRSLLAIAAAALDSSDEQGRVADP